MGNANPFHFLFLRMSTTPFVVAPTDVTQIKPTRTKKLVLVAIACVACVACVAGVAVALLAREGDDKNNNTTAMSRMDEDGNIDWESTTHDIVSTLASELPGGNVIGILLNIFWPQNSVDIWSMIEGKVRALVKEEILKQELNVLRSHLDAVHSAMSSYNRVGDGERPYQLESLLTSLCPLVKNELLRASDPKHVLPIAAPFAVLHMTLLAERVKRGPVYFPKDDPKFWTDELNSNFNDYSSFLKNNYNAWYSWRDGEIGATCDNTNSCSAYYCHTEQHVEVWDNVIDYHDSQTAMTGFTTYSPLSWGLKKRSELFQTAVDGMGKKIQGAYFLHSFIPGVGDASSPRVIQSSGAAALGSLSCSNH
eukprot:c10190_g1_i1.p1 GENE.c10190_g1_i1~~c10190_g1_i1.p1  ORF type:complete len:365 (-),score=65.33 c10190_g1_i1:24-1118(-)